MLTGLLRGAACLPLPLLYTVSGLLSVVVHRVIRYRLKAVRRNLREAFPEKSEKELRRIEREYYRFMCDTIVETVKLLHISDRELARRITVTNPEALKASLDAGRSVALLLGHYGNWEWVQEISRSITADVFKASIYHPLKDRTWDDIYKTIRSRWGIHILPQRSAVRALLAKDHRPWVCGFIADNRPEHPEPGVVTHFLNHHTSFIYGPEVIGRKVGADFYFLEMSRESRGRYRITFHPLDGKGMEEPYPVMRQFWKEFEGVIKEKPAYWLWSHKRWKFDSVIQEAESSR